MTLPDPKWMPYIKMLFGILLLLLLAALSAVIAIKHVEQQTSYGLETILGAIAVLSGQFAQWAFGGGKKDE